LGSSSQNRVFATGSGLRSTARNKRGIKMKEKIIGLWGVAALTILLLSIFLLAIPYLLKGFDVYLPKISFDAYKYFGIGIFLIAAPLSLYSIFFLTRKAGGFPLSRLRGGAPPKLVTTGPYRYIRHPQELGFFMMLLGMAVYLESISIMIYAFVMWVFSHLSAVFVEEPGLIRKFGESYRKYQEEVPRWIPRHRKAINKTKFRSRK
jgi:protein-S-isoprenylcysteine O-methyltransferase Ste14